MKQCSEAFLSKLTSLGRQYDCKVTYSQNGSQVVLDEELYSLSPSYKSALLKSAMKELVIESSVDIPKETIINAQIGLLVDEEQGTYEYLSFGNYVVYESEKQVDEGTYRIKCYDKMIYAMKEYESLGVTYPISVRDYLSALCTKIGLTLKNGTFTNYNMSIPSELFIDQGYTYRDVLDQIAQVVAGTICINANDQVEVRYINETNTLVNEYQLKDVDVNIGEKYGPINSIVLSRAGVDNVYLRDEQSVAQNGLHELKIVDNQIMNFNNRADFLPAILGRLDGLEYYTNDFTSTGLLRYEICDAYLISITGQGQQRCIMFNDEISIDDGMEENVYTELPEEAETDYTKADKTDQRLNQTYLIVDKQNQTIQSVVTNVTEQDNKIAAITQTVDEINSKISDTIDITEEKESLNGSLQFTNVNASEPVSINIKSTGEYVTFLYPWATGEYPANNLYIQLRTLRFTNTETSEVFDWELPDDLLWYNENVYDELVIEYETQTAQILKRCTRTGRNTVEPLGTTQVVPITYPLIELTDGDYTVQMLKYDNEPYPCYIKVRVMKQNIYTTQFYTKVEVDSKISQSATNINLSVDQKLTNYVTTNEMASAINITAQEINSTVSNLTTKVNANTGDIEVLERNVSTLSQTADSITARVERNEDDIGQLQITASAINIEVSHKLDTGDFTNAKITAKINDGTSLVQISANKISLTGKTLDCITDDIYIITKSLRMNAYGNWFYYEDTPFGFIGSSQYAEDHSQKGVSFDLDPNGRFMEWGSRTSSTGNFYSKLFYAREYSYGLTEEGIYLGTNFNTRGYRINIYENSYLTNFSNKGILLNNNGITGGNIIFAVAYYNENAIAVTNSKDLYVTGNIYAANFSSDGRKKKNIEESTTNAIDIIKQIKHRQFDWKDNDTHVSIGYIAQEVEQISPELVTKRDIYDDDKVVDQEYYMKELPLIATATKAIQEQQAIIEDLQNTILQQNALLDIIKERLDIEIEEQPTKAMRKATKSRSVIQQYNEEIFVPMMKEAKPTATIKKQTENGIELVEEVEE